MRREFNVPLLPYLEKYVKKKFFAGLPPPYKIEEDTLLGKQFMSLIIDGRRSNNMAGNKTKMSSTLHIQLSKCMAERSPNLRKLIAINLYFDKLFKDALITWVIAANDCGVVPFVSSKAFLVHFRIDEGEYSHDAAYKHWQRYKKMGYKENTQAEY